ncbi:MAG: rRNA maturation RNase YbeY [Pyrinomonadaceae bacterium]
MKDFSESPIIDIINLQRKVEIDIPAYRSFIEEVFKTVNEVAGRRASVAFVSSNRIKDLNQLFRGKAIATDVLSFPHEADDFDPDKEFLGDIIISAEQALRQARENGLNLEMEIKQLILHGILHLSGYDHESDTGEMTTRELELRDDLRIEA